MFIFLRNLYQSFLSLFFVAHPNDSPPPSLSKDNSPFPPLFSPEVFKDRWEEDDLATLNAIHAKLSASKRRVIDIPPGDPASLGHASTTALVLGQALIYRGCSQIEAAVLLASTEKPVPALTMARCDFETVAFAHFFARNLELCVEGGDRSAITSLIQKHAFGTRLKHLSAEAKENGDDVVSHNILDAIDRLGKTVKGTRQHYEWLSEVVHPNSLGTSVFFSNQEGNSFFFSETGFNPDYMEDIFLAASLLGFLILDNQRIVACVDKIGLLGKHTVRPSG